MAICLGFAFSANADGRSCSVYGTSYTATIASGYTMVSGDDTYCRIDVTAPEGTPNYNGEYITVWVNALDRDTNLVVETAKVRIYVERRKTSGSDYAQFRNLKKGTYYNVSIDSASCE